MNTVLLRVLAVVLSGVSPEPLDEEGAPERQWEELENIQILNEFFEQKRREKSNALL